MEVRAVILQLQDISTVWLLVTSKANMISYRIFTDWIICVSFGNLVLEI